MSRPRLSSAPSALAKHAQRFQELKRGLDQLEYFCKGTVLKRMTKCGKAYCACRSDPNKRPGPYFELTLQGRGEDGERAFFTGSGATLPGGLRPVPQAQDQLQRLEKISQAVLKLQAQIAQPK